VIGSYVSSGDFDRWEILESKPLKCDFLVKPNPESFFFTLVLRNISCPAMSILVKNVPSLPKSGSGIISGSGRV
jgi:hypothetical protein